MSGPVRAGSWAGVIPSAGASVRMGAAKARLRVDGRSFLERTVEALTLAGCEPVLVVVPADAEDLAREARATGARVLRNADPGEGPITSLRLALEALPPGVEGIAYLPVDHPLVRPATVRGLLAAARSGGAELTVPLYGDKRGHPAMFRRTLFGELLDPELEGGARTVVHRHLSEALLVPVDDPGVVADIDTPDAYATLLGDAGPRRSAP